MKLQTQSSPEVFLLLSNVWNLFDFVAVACNASGSCAHYWAIASAYFAHLWSQCETVSPRDVHVKIHKLTIVFLKDVEKHNSIRKNVICYCAAHLPACIAGVVIFPPATNGLSVTGGSYQSRKRKHFKALRRTSHTHCTFHTPGAVLCAQFLRCSGTQHCQAHSNCRKPLLFARTRTVWAHSCARNKCGYSLAPAIFDV